MPNTHTQKKKKKSDETFIENLKQSLRERERERERERPLWLRGQRKWWQRKRQSHRACPIRGL